MDPSKHSLPEISHALLTRRISSVELTEYAIERKKSQEHVNAYKHWDPSVGLKVARQADKRYETKNYFAPLEGIPVSVKDIYGHPDFPIYAGSYRALPDEWKQAGPIVSTLQDHRSVFLGKTHTVEFAYGGLGVNSHWGTPRNPWCKDAHRVPGGSSSGAGISILQGSAFVALGTDTAGSVRIPASYTGVVGLKTSSGLWSTQGIVPLSPLLDTAGILTRTAEDASYAFHAITYVNASYDQQRKDFTNMCELQEKKFRIGLADSGIMWDCEDGISEVCVTALQELQKGGCQIIETEFPNAEMAINMRNRGGTASVELIEFLNSELPDWLDNLDIVISERVKLGGDISAVEYLSRVRQIKQEQEKVLAKFDQFDVLAAPTVPISPPTIEQIGSDKDYMRLNLLALRNTCVASYLNLCAISMPVGLDKNGMPVGIQFIAPPGKERLLLALGQKLETIIPAPQLAA